MAAQKFSLLTIIFDVLVLAIGCLCILLFRLYGSAYKRGFFCDDDTIRYPFKTSLISDLTLHLMCMLVPGTVICINEFCQFYSQKILYQPREHLKLCSWSVPSVLVCLYQKIGIFFFGAAICGVINNITKLSVGKLRPHFLDVCKPDVNCSNERYSHVYVSEYTCTGGDFEQIDNARLSFPSGHALATAYSMLYTILYSQLCVHIRFTNLLKPFLEFFLALVAWYTALSRLSDNMHHLDDILAGLLIGSSVALAVVYLFSNLFCMKMENDTSGLYESIATAPSSDYKTME